VPRQEPVVAGGQSPGESVVVFEDIALYCASNAGLSMLTKATAVDLPDVTTTRVGRFRLRSRPPWSIIWARRRETSAASYDKRP
jgi:hypothetical protein